MTPDIFIISGLLFALSISVHVLVWRLNPACRKTASLFAIFILTPMAAHGALYAFGPAAGPGGAPSVILASYLLNLAVSSAYVLTYPALEALSPSLVIVLLLGGSGVLRRGDLIRVFHEGVLLGPRIEDLKKDGLVSESDGVLALTGKGMALSRFFAFFRAFLGLDRGRG